MDDVPYLDLSDPSFSVRSAAVRDARDRSWYARTNYGLAVLRHAQARQLLKNPSLSQGSARWPDHQGVHGGAFHSWWVRNLLVLEGDEHHRIRRLLTPVFTVASARRLEPAFTDVAEELVAGMVGRGRAEFMAEFAEPYAARALCTLMDLPHGDWPFVAGRASTIGLALSVGIRDEIDRIDRAVTELHDYVETLIADRTAHPGDDIVTRLVQQSEDGERLSQAELRNALVLMIFGGMDTTRNQLGLVMATFAGDPDRWELLAARPDLARPAVEEALRIAPTTSWITREAVETFAFEGVEIAEGTTVHLLTTAAGTDPLAYPDGDRADVAAAASRPAHLAFGGGIHHCLGHQIARADMTVALTVLTRRLTGLRPAGGDEWLPDSGNTGPIRYPVTFEARA